MSATSATTKNTYRGKTVFMGRIRLIFGDDGLADP
jgi:hypothetical protein